MESNIPESPVNRDFFLRVAEPIPILASRLLSTILVAEGHLSDLGVFVGDLML
jgi:hypothetical protein